MLVNFIKYENEILILCPQCNYKVREYDLNPCWPDVEEIKLKSVESPQDLHPNYCENCGIKLK
jgi:DNA-directed RNA polymerase subunit RPC12/RpoP